MGNDPTDIWSWVSQDKKRLSEEGGVKQALVENYGKFWQHFHNDNILAELAINDALDVARAGGEIRWELHLRHWRLQLWLTQDRIKDMLPEAVDLLSLAVDERVKDVPQRICAYHDIVECYVHMDPAGYQADIKENSEHILSQLPKKHPCADCARGNAARAAAAAQKREEAERWLAEHEANRHERRYPGFLTGRANTYVWLQQWDEAESLFQEACQVARKEESYNSYMEALLGVARSRIGQGNLAGAQETVLQVRRNLKYEGETNLLTFLLEVEGHLAESREVPQAALGYFTRSAKLYNELGRYRDAANIALHAVEISNKAHLPAGTSAEALDIAASAVGMLPPASADLYQRLAALGRQPIVPRSDQQEQLVASATGDEIRKSEGQKELAGIEAVLQAHLYSGNVHGVATMLFRLGIWHDEHKQRRAAVDFFIWSAALSRLGKFNVKEHQETLNGLKQISKKLPAGAVIGALHASESAPPEILFPVLRNLPVEQWRWTIETLINEVENKPVVEPVPEGKDGSEQFSRWISHCVSQTALIVRFREQADPVKCEVWAAGLDANAQHIEDQIREENRNEPDAMALPIFIRNLAILSRGADITAIKQSTPAPFNELIEQIELLAREHVWHHPESSPLDYLVEQAVQKAVRALRIHDEQRTSRLANLAFRYELLAIDLRQYEQLNSMANFLIALAALVQNEGAQLPDVEPALEEPYSAILAATFEASQIAESANT